MLEPFIKMLYEYRNRMGLLIGEYSLEKLCLYIYGAGDAFAMCGYDDVQKAFFPPVVELCGYPLRHGTGYRRPGLVPDHPGALRQRSRGGQRIL